MNADPILAVTPYPRELSLQALNPTPEGKAHYYADPAATALLTHFWKKLFRFNQDPGKSRSLAEAKAHGLNILGWLAWQQFHLCTQEYQEKQTDPALLPAVRDPAEFDAWARAVLKEYGLFLLHSGGCQPQRKTLRLPNKNPC